MKCFVNSCTNEAVTFHGVSTVTHGYCAEHRCCAGCGNRITACDCRCGHPTEREDYLNHLSRTTRPSRYDAWEGRIRGTRPEPLRVETNSKPSFLSRLITALFSSKK